MLSGIQNYAGIICPTLRAGLVWLLVAIMQVRTCALK